MGSESIGIQCYGIVKNALPFEARARPSAADDTLKLGVRVLRLIELLDFGVA